VAIYLFNQQVHISIREGRIGQRAFTAVLSTLAELDPFNITGTPEFAFWWLAELLNSGYPEDEQYQIASAIMALLWKYFQEGGSKDLQPAWMPPLLGFLSLCERFYATGSAPNPGVIALWILSSSPRRSGFAATIFPVLASILLPTHPLQSRRLALEIFCKFTPEWLSFQTENILDQDLNRFLRAVGDPFQFPSDPPLQDGQPAFTVDYRPMRAVVVLIEFASFDWKNYLRHSNLASCEEVLSTEDGKKTALELMLHVATHSWPKFLHTPAKITAATRRLEDLRCLNTAEVVIMWAWTAGVIDPADHDAWISIGHDTLRLCQTNEAGCPMALKRHITDTFMDTTHITYLARQYEGVPCRVGSVRQPDPDLASYPYATPRDFVTLPIYQICQLRRLYHLFGYDPTAWREAVTAEEGEQTTDVFSGRPVAPVSFMYLACDYP